MLLLSCKDLKSQTYRMFPMNEANIGSILTGDETLNNNADSQANQEAEAEPSDDEIIEDDPELEELAAELDATSPPCLPDPHFREDLQSTLLNLLAEQEED